MNFYSLIEKQVQDETIKKISIGVVIKIIDKYLVLKRVNTKFLEGYYEIPTGNLEFGETVEECVYRVVNETAKNAIAPNIQRYLGHFDYISSSDNKKTRQYNFLVHVQNFDIIRLSEKHDEFRFVDIYECENNLDMSDETLFILKIANMSAKFNIIG